MVADKKYDKLIEPIKSVYSMLKEYFCDVYYTVYDIDEYPNAVIKVVLFGHDEPLEVSVYWDDCEEIWRVGDSEFGPELEDVSILVGFIRELVSEKDNSQ